jgi:hypothetical protein
MCGRLDDTIMAEPLNSQNGFSDAVCIDAGRVYDSCMDRDCLENMRVYFSDEGQEAIQNASGVKVKSADVVNVSIDVEPVTFNRGFFSCDLTFYFAIKCEITLCSNPCPQEITGVCTFSKKVILCGSEASVKTFSSEKPLTDEEFLSCGANVPKCVVECVDPVVLDSKVCEVCSCDCIPHFPPQISLITCGKPTTCGTRALYVSLGLFSIVQLIRNVQMLIPVYDFCVPEKECVATNDNPCEMFSRIKFPTEEFFPSGDICETKCK